MENETTDKSAIGDCTGAVGHGYKKRRRGRGKSALLLDIRCSSLMFININNKTILICNDDLACQPTVDAYLPQPIVDYMSRTVASRYFVFEDTERPERNDLTRVTLPFIFHFIFQLFGKPTWRQYPVYAVEEGRQCV